MKKATLALTSTLGLALGSLHAQTVPQFMNYQGRVTDSQGNGLGAGTPVNRKVIFRIFDAATGGNRLWSEQHTVTISNGEFSVLLGNGIDAVYNNVTETPTKTNTPLDTVFTTAGVLRYVEILVDNGDNTINAADAPIAPRQQITSTAYSFRARSADSIATGTDLQLNGNANYGLGYYGTGRTFNGVAVDGPVLYGQAGGALGSVNGGTRNIALRWNAAGAVGVGSADLSGAGATTKLVLQGDDTNTVPLQLNIRGNSDTNKRLLLGFNTTANYGSLQAYGAANTTTSLLLNPAGGNVGIGTTSAGNALTVAGNASVSGDLTANRLLTNSALVWNDVVATRFQVSGTSGYVFSTGDNDGGLFSPADGTIVIRTDATEKVRVTPGGSVGIGTTGPISMLDVRGPSAAITVGATDGSAGTLQFGNPNHGVKRNYSAGNDVGLFTTAGDVYLSAQGSAGTNGLVLKSAGNVGIGTNSPASKLTVQTDSTVGLTLRGLDVDKKLELGYDVVNDYATIQAIHHNVVYTNLLLNPAGGRVAIGNSNPGAPLHVSGSVSTTFLLAAYMDQDTVTAAPNSTSTQPHSIISDARVRAAAFDVMSDSRIKNILGRSDGDRDLKTLMDIQVTDYTFKDRVALGDRPQKKVIAQQVEKVFPQAVNQSVNVVPDIFSKATIKDGWVQLATELKKGDRVRLLSGKLDQVQEVLEVTPHRFRTASLPKEDTVFVYGREVKDFRSVDYEAIAMLNVSATQQLEKRQAAEIKDLRDENAALRAKISAMETQDTALSARLSALEKALLASEPKPAAASTVSIQKAASTR